jgi:hypothetical protein
MRCSNNTVSRFVNGIVSGHVASAGAKGYLALANAVGMYSILRTRNLTLRRNY